MLLRVESVRLLLCSSLSKRKELSSRGCFTSESPRWRPELIANEGCMKFGTFIQLLSALFIASFVPKGSSKVFSA